MRFVAVDGLRLRHFEGEAVVFDPVSWDAHLLNPTAIAVLDLFLEAPRSEAEVVAFLADALQPDVQPLAAAYGTRLIEDLRSLGLIQLSQAAASADC